jgi:hypothetical protein
MQIARVRPAVAVIVTTLALGSLSLAEHGRQPPASA